MLNNIGVPTIKVVAHTECLLLLEDLLASETCRLGIEKDMSDVNSIRMIARWFKQLHTNGQQYEGLPQLNLQDDVPAVLGHERIITAMEKSKTGGNPFWPLLLNNAEHIKTTYQRLCNTITYNDFGWDNMAVAKDGSAAIMFDYNCVFRKYAYADIRHILSVIPDEAGAAFMDEYGGYDAYEKTFEEMYFPVSGVIDALNLDVCPPWADKFLTMLHSGELMRRLAHVL